MSGSCPECRRIAREKGVGYLRSVTFTEKYVENVINRGSAQRLGFAYGDMQAGFADEAAAPKIAAYVVSLSGRTPTHPEWIAQGRTFYVSNCGGCHGEDGKGIHGTFPDLTRDPLLGIERRIRDALRPPK
ncbi:c-type cytochrome [Hydrogenimonas sp.]